MTRRIKVNKLIETGGLDFSGMGQIADMVEKGLKILLDPNTEIQFSKLEQIFLVKHNDSFFILFPTMKLV